MRFPGIAYSFMRDTDVAGPTALILSRHFSVSSSLALLEFLFTDLPKDRVLVLTNVAVAGLPGASQGVREVGIQGISQGEENFTIAHDYLPGTNDLRAMINWQGEVYIQGGGPGTTTVRLLTFFTDLTNANTMTIGIHGIIIPRGNLGGF